MEQNAAQASDKHPPERRSGWMLRPTTAINPDVSLIRVIPAQDFD
jgi:hypothetical protein